MAEPTTAAVGASVPQPSAAVAVSAQSINVPVDIPTPGIVSLLNWSYVWLAIASDQVAAAHDARKSYDSDPSHALTAEFHAGLVAIAAAAFAIEAEQLKVHGSEPTSASEPPPRPWRRNKGDWLGQNLIERGAITDTEAEALGRLFDLRNASVHPEAENETLVPHPVGTNTSPEVVAYNADVAEAAAALAVKIVAAISS
jgi:hypothetical protein